MSKKVIITKTAIAAALEINSRPLSTSELNQKLIVPADRNLIRLSLMFTQVTYEVPIRGALKMVEREGHVQIHSEKAFACSSII